MKHKNIFLNECPLAVSGAFRCMAMAVVLSSYAFGVEAEQESESLEEIVQLHENRVNSCKTIELIFDLTNFSSKLGDTLKRVDIYFGKDGDVERTVYKMEQLVESVVPIPTAGMVNDQYYNGADTYIMMAPPEKYEQDSVSVGDTTVRGRIHRNTKLYSGVFPPFLWSFSVNADPGVMRPLGYLVDHYGGRVVAETESKAGDRLIQVRMNGSGQNGGRWTLDVWINADKDYMIERARKEFETTRSQDGDEIAITFVAETQVQEFLRLEDGAWFPKKVEGRTSNSSSESYSGGRFEIKDIKINETPSPRISGFRFLENLSVTEYCDDGGDCIHHIWGDGEPRMTFFDGDEFGRYLYREINGEEPEGITAQGPLK